MKKKMYKAPETEIINIETEKQLAAGSDNFNEPPTGNTNIYPNETAKPETALGKGNNMWDDWDE